MKQLIKSTLLIFFLSTICIDAPAQVTFSEESNVTNLMNKFRGFHQQQITQKAWRIQVVTTNDRRNMETAMAKLNQMYPELDPSWTHASPYYQVKVGAFEDKVDLQNLLITLKRDFPSAIPVMDDIEKVKLL